MRHSPRTLKLAALVLFACACTDTSAKPDEKCAIDLGQSSQSPDDSIGPVVIKLHNTTDTVPGVLTSLRPVISPDGRMHGIVMTAQGEAINGFEFDPCIQKMTLYPLPSDLNGNFHEIAISPDARFIAYVAHAKSGETHGVVRSWPQMQAVYEASPSQGYPSDVNSDEVQWIAKNRFRISYRVESGSYVVINGGMRKRERR